MLHGLQVFFCQSWQIHTKALPGLSPMLLEKLIASGNKSESVLRMAAHPSHYACSVRSLQLKPYGC